jgi:dipeptidyl aminopeptidase/acylaminoacyl peptidase
MKYGWIILISLGLALWSHSAYATDWKQTPEGTIIFIGRVKPIEAIDSTYEVTFTEHSIKVTPLPGEIRPRDLAWLNVDKMESMWIKGKGVEKKRFGTYQWDKLGNMKELESYAIPASAGREYHYNWKCKLLSYEAFKDNPRKPTWKIEVMNLKDGILIPINTRGVNDLYPSISPDGKWLAFYSAIPVIPTSNPVEDKYNYELLIVDAYTGKKYLSVPVGMCDEFSLYACRWNARGDKLVYIILNGDKQGLAVLNVKTGNVIKMNTEGKGRTWSPDGRYIAYTRSIHDDPKVYNEIWLYDVDKNQNIQITNSKNTSYYYADYEPRWDPDGRYIVFQRAGKLAKEWAKKQLWIVEIETLKTQCIDSSITPGTYQWIPK